MKVAKEAVKTDGLTTLYEPDDPTDTGLDIIFVHGLGGHPVKSWLHTSVKVDAPAKSPGAPTTITKPARRELTRSKSLTKAPAFPFKPRGNTLKKRPPPGQTDPQRASPRNSLPPRPQPAESRAQRSHEEHGSPPTPKHSTTRTPLARSKSTAASPLPVQNQYAGHTVTETYWPLDLLPESCPTARILTYGFETYMVDGRLSIGQLDIFARGRELLDAIDDLRRGGNAGREMVFIAHSTGGIVVKEMLRLASNLLDVDDEGLLASIASVIFMACPLRGTDYGSMVIAMKSMAAATAGVPIDDATLGRMLGGDEDAHLTYLGCDAFESVWREYNFRVKVYRETAIEPPSQPWAEFGLALRRDASTLMNNPEEDEDIPGDHVNMCRFAPRRDEGYQLVSSYVTRLAHFQTLKRRQLPEKEHQIQQALADPGASDSRTRIGLLHERRIDAAVSSTDRPVPRWLLQHPRFQTWLHRSTHEDKHKILWLTGPPGSGASELLSSLRARLAQDWAPETRSSVIITIAADEGEPLLDSVVMGDNDSQICDDFDNYDENDNENDNNNNDHENDDEDSPSRPDSYATSAHETPQDTSPIPNTPVRTLRSLLSQLYAHDPRLRNLVRRRTATAGPLHDDDLLVETLSRSPNLLIPLKHHYYKVDNHNINATTATTTTTTKVISDPNLSTNLTNSSTDLLIGAQIGTQEWGHGAPAKVLDDADVWALFWEDYLCLGLPKHHRQQQQTHQQLLLDGKRTKDDSFKVEIPSLRRVFILVDVAGIVADKHLSGLIWWLSQLARRSEFSVCVASTAVTMPPGSASSRSARSRADSSLLIQVPEENAEEIRLYLDTHLLPDMEEREAIAAKMLDRAAGVVLWVEMVTKIVNEASEEGVSGEIVLSMLDDIAPWRSGSEGLLDDLYAWKLSRLSEIEQAQALAVMQWVMLASEPLKLNELVVALRLTLFACRPGSDRDNNNNGSWDTSKTLEVEPALSLKELRAADGDALGIGTAMMDSPTQFWKWLQQLSQGLLRLESEGSVDSTISTVPLGLQHVRPTHESVHRFFLKGRGFQTLLPPDDPQANTTTTLLPSTDRFIDTSYYTLLHVCLVYLNVTELDALSREKPPLNPAPGSALPPMETSKWRAHTDAQRRMVMSSYPLLRYAVDHLLFHLLCPREYRYFLPQGALLGLLAANRCRIWRRWTHLLGFSIADATPEALLARAATGPAGRLLAPVYGARYRLERVLRRVWRMAVEQQRSGGGGGGGGGGGSGRTTPRTTPSRAHFRARSDVSEGSVTFMLMGGEDPMKASWLVPTSPGRSTRGGEAAAPRALSGIEEVGGQGREAAMIGKGGEGFVAVAPEG